jgi:hypothetical protein
MSSLSSYDAKCTKYDKYLGNNHMSVGTHFTLPIDHSFLQLL